MPATKGTVGNIEKKLARNKIQIFNFIPILSPKKPIFFMFIKVTYLSEINNFEWIMPYFQGGDVFPEISGCLDTILPPPDEDT